MSNKDMQSFKVGDLVPYVVIALIVVVIIICILTLLGPSTPNSTHNDLIMSI
jgi:hypothetical protein